MPSSPCPHHARPAPAMLALPQDGRTYAHPTSSVLMTRRPMTLPKNNVQILLFSKSFSCLEYIPRASRTADVNLEDVFNTPWNKK